MNAVLVRVAEAAQAIVVSFVDDVVTVTAGLALVPVAVTGAPIVAIPVNATQLTTAELVPVHVAKAVLTPAVGLVREKR